MVAAEFKMRSVRYLDAGLFRYQAQTSPMPERFNPEGRTNPMAWAFHGDTANHNSFSKLVRYEAHLQREFSRALRDPCKMQDERRARLAEAASAEGEAAEAASGGAEAAPSEPKAPPAPKKRKRNGPNSRRGPAPQTGPASRISP